MRKYPILLEKPRIAKLFVSRVPNKRSPVGGRIDVAMAFDDGRYVEYDFSEKADSLTYWLSRRIMEMFRSYRIDGGTDVCIVDSMSEKDPFYVYLACLSQQIGFDLFIVDRDQVVRRVAKTVTHPLLRKNNKYIRKPKEISFKHLQPVWRYIVRKDRCSWINPRYDAALQAKSYKTRIRKQFLRLGMYYMYEKEYARKYEVGRDTHSEKRARQETSAAV